jgi:hypothetical protein
VLATGRRTDSCVRKQRKRKELRTANGFEPSRSDTSTVVWRCVRKTAVYRSFSSAASSLLHSPSLVPALPPLTGAAGGVAGSGCTKCFVNTFGLARTANRQQVNGGEDLEADSDTSHNLYQETVHEYGSNQHA